jgi:ubiquitin
MAELEHAFNIKTSLSDKTKTNYKNYYKRMVALLEGKEIIKSTNKKIIKVLKDDKEIPASSKQALLNVAIVIKQTHELKTNDLIKYRDNGREKLSEQIATKNIELEKELPSLAELKTFMNELYKVKDWDAFLVNYLLINFGVRNMDLDLIITIDKEDVTNGDNYLLVQKSTIKYIRFNYKTAKTYKAKQNVIRSAKVMKACMELLGDEPNALLLSTNKGKRIADNSLNNAVSSKTFDGIGETKYFKVLVKDSGKSVAELSKNRGTAINTISSNYDVKNQEAIKEQTPAEKKLNKKK